MKNSKLLILFVGAVFVFLAFPILIVIIVSFNKAGTLHFPIQGLTLEYYALVIQNKAFMRSFANSFKIATLATFLSLALGTPVAYIMAKYKKTKIARLRQLFFSPILIPGIVLSYALYRFLIAELGFSGLSTLVLAHTLILFPYTIRVLGAGLEDFDFSIEDAARSLGANRWTLFRKIILPILSSGIIATAILSYITSLNNVPVSLFLTDRKSNTLPLVMMEYVEYYFNPAVAALSVYLILLILAVMFITEKMLGIKKLGSS